MTTPNGDLRGRVAALVREGLTDREIARALHYSRIWITVTRCALQREGVLARRVPAGWAPWVPPDGRAAALARGRALVAAKLAAGEWVLPKGAGE